MGGAKRMTIGFKVANKWLASVSLDYHYRVRAPTLIGAVAWPADIVRPYQAMWLFVMVETFLTLWR